jgi:hypothetical protein
MKLSTLTSLLVSSTSAVAFAPPKCIRSRTCTQQHKLKYPAPLHLSSEPPEEEEEEYSPDRLIPADPSDSRTDAEGASLASEFFQMLQDRNIQMTGDEIEYADLEEEEFQDSRGEYNPDAGALDASDQITLKEYQEYEIAREFMEVEEDFTDDDYDEYVQSLEFADAGEEEGMLAAVGSGEVKIENVYRPPGILMPDHNLPARDVVELGRLRVYPDVAIDQYLSRV